MPQTATGIKVACFEINQDAGSKTDYRHVITHDALDTALTARLERELTAVHRSLASKLPRREVVVLFPSRDPASDQPLFCLCRCVTIDRPGARPILRLQAIVGSPAQARGEGGDLLDLLESPVWARISENRVPVAAAASARSTPPIPENGTTSLIEQTASAFRQRTGDPFLLEIPDDTPDLMRAREILRGAMSLLNEKELECVSLGVGIPAGCSLPTRPAVIVPEPAASAAEPAPRGLPDSYLHFLRRLAVDLSECTDTSVLWRQRLWNKTHDLLAIAEEFGRRAAPAPRPAPVGMRSATGSRGMVSRRDMDAAAAASQELGREMGRAGLARKVGDLEKQTATFLDYLLPSVREDPRPRDARPVALLLVVIAAIAGGLAVASWQGILPTISPHHLDHAARSPISSMAGGPASSGSAPAIKQAKAAGAASAPHPRHLTPPEPRHPIHHHG